MISSADVFHLVRRKFRLMGVSFDASFALPDGDSAFGYLDFGRISVDRGRRDFGKKFWWKIRRPLSDPQYPA